MKPVSFLKYSPLLLLVGAVALALIPLFKGGDSAGHTYGEPDGEETDEAVGSFVD